MRGSTAEFYRRLERGARKLVSEPGEWVLLVGNRFVLAASLTALFAITLFGILATDVIAVRRTTRLLYLFQVLVGANVTLLTIVLSINQLVLSRELNPPGQLRDQIRNTIEYRRDVQRTTRRDQTPIVPGEFLTVLLEGTKANARRLQTAVDASSDGRITDDVDSLADDVTERADEVLHSLDRPEEGIFSSLSAIVETNFSRDMREIQHVRSAYDRSLSDDATGALDALEDNLKQLDIARQYFRALYLQDELAGLSKVLLYVGIPAVASALLMLFVYTGTAGTPVRLAYLEVLVPAVIVLGFVPLAVLFAFVLRIATIARRTAAMTPFTLPREEGGSGG